MDASTLALLAAACGVAGFVDAVAGGGGLLTVPALMLGLPAGTPVPTLLGTNKFLASAGTTMAVAKYTRARALDWKEAAGPFTASAIGAAAGVGLAYRIPSQLFRPLLLILLSIVLVFTLLRPGLGTIHAPRHSPARQRALATLIGGGLGFYDGFFGPGTGAFLVFLFVTVLGFDFLRASGLAKAVNWASNLASVVLFVALGSWIPSVALVCAVANGLGGWLGAHVALEKGAGFVRGLFLFVVTALLIRLGWQTFRG